MNAKYGWTEAASRWALAVAVAVSSVTLVGCDLEVVNPGPIDDTFLDDAAAYSAIINGVSRNMNYALNTVVADGGIRTREIHLSDVNDWNGFSFPAHMGFAVADAPNYLGPWGNGQAARWIGDDFVRRVTAVLTPEEFRKSATVARGHLWAAYANRLMGDYFCQAVFDGGPAQSSDAFHKRAEELFATAIEIGTASGATETTTAARAGRASVRARLGNWAGAVEDAKAVPTSFNYKLPYYTDGDWRYYNNLAHSNGQTVWNTPYADYYTQTRDPRTPWVQGNPPVVTSTVEPWIKTGVPWYLQQKYKNWGDGVRLSSGAEMRLVEAEALLRQNNVSGAMQLINSLRDRVSVRRWPTPGSLDEAWSLLKKERGIELWLEGRRFADFRRWEESKTPGALDPHELGKTNGGPDLKNRVLCLPIPDVERDRNSNLRSS